MYIDINRIKSFFSQEDIEGKQNIILRNHNFCKLLDTRYGIKSFEKENIISIFEYSKIINSIWAILGLVYRIEDTHNLSIQEKINSNIKDLYLKLDIKFIHYEIRSIFDHIAELISLVYKIDLDHKKRGKYSQLIYLVNNSKVDDYKLSEFIKEYIYLFEFIRDIRGDFIHSGKDFVIFTNNNLEIGFRNQYKKFSNYKFTKGTIRKNNANNPIIDIKIYLTQIISNIFILLDEISILIINNSSFNQNINCTSLSSIGILTFLNWISNYEEHIKNISQGNDN